MALPRAYRYEDEFAAAVAEVAKELPPEVVRVRYEFREDWVGEPSVFFNFTLADDAFVRGEFADLSTKIFWILNDRLDPEEEWGVHMYLRYRTVSEQERLQEPAWA